MQYTPEQLAQMIEHEINLAVAKKLNLVFVEFSAPGSSWVEYIPYDFIKENKNYTFEEYDSLGQVLMFNPCSNWNDVMPIAYKYGINIRWILETDHSNVGGFEIGTEENVNGVSIDSDECNNPLCAICEVFLMMDID